MQWSELFNNNIKPTYENINEFVDTSLWGSLNAYLQQTYGVEPKLSYSCCSMQKGWNIKYQKSGKSLCTLYPMRGFFIALIVIGKKEIAEADLLIPMCNIYTQDLYHQTIFGTGGKWLMLNITNDEILQDSKNLILLRLKPQK